MRHRHLMLLLLALLPFAGCQQLARFTSTARDASGDGPRDSGPGDGADDATDAAVDLRPDAPPGGTHLWSHVLGHAGAVGKLVATVRGDGDVFVVGTFRGVVDLGGGHLTSAGHRDVFVASFSAAAAHHWSRRHGGGGEDVGLDIAVDDSGNVLVTGTFEASASLGGDALTSVGERDIFVACYDAASGDHRWSSRYGGSGDDQGLAIAVDDSGDLRVAGFFEGTADLGGAVLTSDGDADVFVAAYEGPSGDHIWSRGGGGNNADVASDVAVDQSGATFVVGTTVSTTINLGGEPLSSAETLDFFVARYDGLDGAHGWSKRHGGASSDSAIGVAVSGTGEVIVTGYFADVADFGNTQLTSAGGTDAFIARYVAADGTSLSAIRFGGSGFVPEEASSAAVDGSGNVYYTGSFVGSATLGTTAELTSAGGRDVVLARQGAAGNFLWSHAFGGVGDDMGLHVAVDHSDNVILSGRFARAADLGGGEVTSVGTGDPFVASYQGDGEHRWALTFAGAGWDTGAGLAVDSAGNVIVIGSFVGTADLGGSTVQSSAERALFVASFAPDGEHRWARGIDGAASDSSHGVAVDPADNVYITGYFKGTTSFGGATLTASGNSDVFVASYDQNGKHRWSKRFGDDSWADGSGIAADQSGQVFVAGSFAGTIDFGGGALADTSTSGGDVFLASFTATGEHRWSARRGGAARDEATALAVDRGGNPIVAGAFFGPADFGGGTLTCEGPDDLFLASYAGDGGAHLWSVRHGGAEGEVVTGLAVSPDDRLFVTGRFTGSASFGVDVHVSAGSNDVFLAGYQAADGQALWSRSWGGTEDDVGKSVAIDGSGDVVVTGGFGGVADFGGSALTSAGETDVFVVSCAAADGALRWAKRFGSGLTDRGYAVAATATAVLVTGRFDERIDLGGSPLRGVFTGFLAALAP